MPGVLTAVAVVFGGVFLTIVILGSASPSAVAFGAMAGLGYALAAPFSLALAAGVLFSLAFAPRAMRARSTLGRWAVVSLALLLGGLGSSISVSYANQGTWVAMSATVVGALLAALPLLIAVDDTTTYGLRMLTDSTTGALRQRVLRAVALRRRSTEIADVLSRSARRRFERAWRAVARIAKASASARTSRETLETHLSAYLHALHRALRAAENAAVLTKDVDDAVLAELRHEGEDLEAHASALAEVRAV